MNTRRTAVVALSIALLIGLVALSQVAVRRLDFFRVRAIEFAGVRHLDERDIVRQLHNYCRAVDRCDMALGLGVYHDDATVDYGAMFQGTGH